MQNNEKIRDDKIKMMQDRQKRWMEQRLRQSSGEEGSLAHSRQPQIANKQRQQNKKNVKEENEVLLWASRDPESPPATFIVRNKDNRNKTSARSDKSSKSKIGTKLKDVQSRPDDSLQSKLSFESDAISKSKMKCGYDLGPNTPGVVNNDSTLVSRNRHDTSKFTKSIQDATAMNNIDDNEQHELLRNTEKLKLSEEKQKTSFSMHCCSMCKKLMDKTSNFPYLMIPCGHNICAQCLPKKVNCPMCHSQISSTIENRILGEVIAQHQMHQKQEELKSKEKEARKFIEEYDKLNTRYDVMKSRAEEVIQNMEDITQSLIEKKNAMRQIEMTATKIKDQIKSLQEKLTQCEEEYHIDKKQNDELELKYEKEKEGLEMLEQTLHQINASRERVKLLIQSFIPSYEFEKYIN